MRRRLLCLLFLCFVSVFFFSPAAHAEGSEPTLQALSAEIHTQLDGLRQQSRHLTEQLLVAENELRTSSRQVEALQTELRDLNGCLENTNRKLGEYSQRLTEYETKLRFRARVIAAAASILILAVVVRAVLLFLKIRFGIRIPYLLNLLL